MIFLLYTILESFLKACYQDGYIDLGLGILMPIIEKRDMLLKTIYSTLWKPLTPILSPLWWGLTLKFVREPGFLKDGLGVQGPSISLTILLIIKTLLDLERGCPDSLVLGRNLEDFCTRNCAETLFSVVFLLALLVGTWSGWEWDGSLVNLLMEWQRRKIIEWKEMELKKSNASEGIRRRVK